MMRNELLLAVAAMVLVAGAGAADEVSQGEADAVFRDYIATRGNDFEACFDALPELMGPEGPSEFRSAGDGPVPLRRLIVAVDASGSMAGRFGGRTKMAAAREATLAFLADTPGHVEAGLVAFGHRGNNEESGRAESCAGVETLAAPGAGRAALRDGIAGLEPTGWTPLAAAIEAAAAQLSSGEDGEQVVYIVSDGEETCGGDPVGAARALREGDLRAVVNIIGFDLAAADRQQLMEVARAGGGSFSEADPDAALQSELERLLARAHNANEMTEARAGAANAGTANRAEVANHLTTLRACVANAGVKERAGVSSFLREGAVDGATGTAVEDRLAARHEEIAARVEAVESRAEAVLNAAQDRIDERLEEAQEGYEETQEAD